MKSQFIRRCKLDSNITIEYHDSDEFLEDSDSVFHDMLKEYVGSHKYNDDKEIAARNLAGFYWQTCVQGCLPDGDPVGPFKTADECENEATRDYELKNVEHLPGRSIIWEAPHNGLFYWTKDKDNTDSTKLNGPFGSKEAAREDTYEKFI
jgi:hypothetical protein